MAEIEDRWHLRDRRRRRAHQRTEQAAVAEPRRGPLWASFTQVDVRSFWVAFTATVAGTTGSLVIVALAVLFDRWHPHGAASDANDAVNYLANFLTLPVLLAWVWRPRTERGRKRRRVVLWIGAPLVTLWLTFAALAGLGLAVGVK